MPEDAPRAKLENTRRLGGEVITYDRYTGDREAIAREDRRGAGRRSWCRPTIMSTSLQGRVPSDLRSHSSAPNLALSRTRCWSCCGGGGLIAGTAIALKAQTASVNVHPVEPEDFDDTARSLLSGKREHADSSARSICDALQAHSPGEMTFAINRELLGDGLVVSDAEVRAAMRFAFANLKLVVEPGGAVALAAVLSGKDRHTRKDHCRRNQWRQCRRRIVR